MDTRGYLSGVKRPGRVADHLPPSGAELIALSCDSTPPYVLMSWFLINYGDNFPLSVFNDAVSISEYNIGCPKSLDPVGILIIFLIFIYRLKLNVKRLKMALKGWR
jgi:hypothetical protein